MISLLQNQTLSCHWKGILEETEVSYRIYSAVLINLGYEVFGFGPCFPKSKLTQSFRSISVSAVEGPQGLPLSHLVALGEPQGDALPMDLTGHSFPPVPRPQFLQPCPSMDTMSHPSGADELSFPSLAGAVHWTPDASVVSVAADLQRNTTDPLLLSLFAITEQTDP